MAQIFHKIRNANNNRNHKKRNGQQVHFYDEVKTHEYEASEEEQPGPNIVDKFQQIPFEPPRLGYSMGIHAAASVGAYDLVQVGKGKNK